MKITKSMIKENTVFNCNTEEKADEFLKKLNSLGYKWADGTSYLDDNYYNRYKEDTCYYPYKSAYGNTRFSKMNNYDIIEYELDEFEIDNIKDGYLVITRYGEKHLCCNTINDEKVIVDSCGGFLYTKQYDCNFNIDDFTSEHDIIKIYGRTKGNNSLLKYETDDRKLLWEREEPIEMTMEEIYKELGKNIKIIK